MPEIKIGFIETNDWQDNQYSISVLEEALIKGIRSGMDKIWLVTYNEGIARPLSGKIEMLSSYGTFQKFDVLCLGLSPNQKKPSILVPSQEMNPIDDEG